MGKITQDNFERKHVDPIEQRQIDKLVCDEVSRQIHRYIKGILDSKAMMEKFEAQLSTLSVPQKKEIIARYVNLNRKVLSRLDLGIVLTRVIANYCDTFNYMLELVNDERKWAFYLNCIKSKYIQHHTVIEQDGKFGLCNHHGNILVHPIYNFVRTCYIYVDDLVIIPVIVQREGKVELILPDGEDIIMAPFEFDNISLHEEYPYFETTREGEQGFIRSDGQFVVASSDQQVVQGRDSSRSTPVQGGMYSAASHCVRLSRLSVPERDKSGSYGVCLY